MIDLNFAFYNQIILAITGITAIYLVARKNKWGFVFGLLSQPSYLWMFITAKQWGALLISIVYTFEWMLGIYFWFYVNGQRKPIILKRK